MLHLHGQITSEVTLHGCSRFGIGVEIPLQGANLPTYCTDRILDNRFDFGLETAEDQRGANDLTRSQGADVMSIPRHPDLPTDNERHGLWNRAALDHALAAFRRDPGSNAQDPQDLPRRQVLENQPPDFFFLGRKFDGLTLHEEAP